MYASGKSSHMECHFFLRHEHAYFQYIYSSIYDSKDQKQLNNTKKNNLIYFPLLSPTLRNKNPTKELENKKIFG